MVGLLLRAANMESDVKEEFTAVRAELGNVAVRVHEIDVHVREVHARLRDVDTRLSEVDTRLSEVDTRLSEVDTRLSSGIRRVETTLRQEIREEGIATRRHFDVVTESLRDDIRIIAEGFVALDTKVERIRDSR
jgi:septal ring factor EnvC (AmiA/AmiB activator)